MIINDTLPYLICNECALHLNVAYNLKGKCLTTEKYFLHYLSGETDTKENLICQPTITEFTSSAVMLNDLNQEANSDGKPLALENNPQPTSTSNEVAEVNTTSSEHNELNKKYTRPNLMVYFERDTIIELSDTDSDTDTEDQTSLVQRVRKEAPSNKATYECPACPESFSDLFTFNNHVKDHNPKLCKVCSRVCNTGANLIGHFRTHRPDQREKCPNCDYTNTSKSVLCDHIRKNHNRGCDHDTTLDYRKTTKCNKCVEYFSSVEEFRIHLHAHHNITVENNIEAGKFMTIAVNAKELKCQICQRQMKNSISYSLHMKLHQTNKLKYCYVCKISFKSNMSLHFKERHPGLPPYKCTDHCNETFTNQKVFDAHLRVAKKRSIGLTEVRNFCVVD